ncbi:hypothetical protein V7x_32090 [Crateriforma conspicua]|uniref:Uncharacterized protein n=1 Tax=Crateriforma conspicua TaxID=2527996 RepID=A0A5C6FZ63_9PLAN|nr:hypothetical protein V7x_32090 [Crateriforma conspicua]
MSHAGSAAPRNSMLLNVQRPIVLRRRAHREYRMVFQPVVTAEHSRRPSESFPAIQTPATHSHGDTTTGCVRVSAIRSCCSDVLSYKGRIPTVFCSPDGENQTNPCDIRPQDGCRLSDNFQNAHPLVSFVSVLEILGSR